MFLFESYFDSFSAGMELCRAVGGETAVPEDNVGLEEWKEVIRRSPALRPGLTVWTGYTDRETENLFVSSLSETLMTWTDWEEDQPNDWGGREDCVNYNTVTELLRDNYCGASDVAMVCKVPNSVKFMLRGVCIKSPADSFYVGRRSDLLLGYTQSQLVLSVTRRRWEIQFSRNNSLIAFMNQTLELPLGEHDWYFTRGHCKDEDKTSRTLNFHISLSEPGHFCCSDGVCIDSEQVCDNKYHCKGRTDEDKTRCQMVVLDSEYEKEKAPRERDSRSGNDNTQITANLSLMEVISIDETRSEFCLLFSLVLEWRDSKVYYTFLKNQMEMNVLKKDKWSSIWLPNLTFTTLTGDAEKVKIIDQNIYIRKLGRPELSQDVDKISVSEMYEGTENKIYYSLMSQATFSCPFNSIKYYPFGDEECQFKFYISGSDNRLTNISQHQINLLIPDSSLEVGRYKIKGTKMERFDSHLRRHMTVTIFLSRSIVSILLVTYVPTALMNIINQAINYIQVEEKHDLIITVNITCMMVLASVYLSVSTSLPNTQSIKPVEIWLLFNLAYPFLVIIANIIKQVALYNISLFDLIFLSV